MRSNSYESVNNSKSVVASNGPLYLLPTHCDVSGCPIGLTNVVQLQIIVFDKSTAWAFKDLHPRYKEIFSQPDYPKTYPCTVSEDYACVTHSKFEVTIPFRSPFSIESDSL